VEFVEDARLYPVDLTTGSRGDQVTRIDVDPQSLIFPFEHQILVQSNTEEG
jgi:hypothetical protein